MATKKLRVSIGPNIHHLSVYNVNSETNPMFVESEYFTGRIVVRVRDFAGYTRDASPPIPIIKYFDGKTRNFSVQVQGRFKQEFLGNDIVFGTEFERKVDPPTGKPSYLRTMVFLQYI